jgi:nicotinamidase-related amidase
MQHALQTFTEMFGFEQPAARFDQAVVVVIDMQREYLDGAVPLPDLERTAEAASRLLALARERRTPVIHVLNEGPAAGKLFNREGPYYPELPQVAAQPGEAVVVKGLPNAFAGTELHALIQKTGRNQLILAGCTTHVCVSATARAALDLGYQTTVVADATTSRDLGDGAGGVIAAETVKRVALAELRDAFAAIVNSADELL